MNKLFILFFILIKSVFVIAQINTVWNYDQTLDLNEEGKLIISDLEYNIFIVGEHGTITKLNHFGDTIFVNLDTSNYDFDPISINRSSDSSLILVGNYKNGTLSYIRIQKLNLDGSIVWQSSIYPDSATIINSNSIEVDESDNIYITGQNNKDFYTAKISTNGNIIWESLFSSPTPSGSCYSNKIIVKDQNNIYAVGAYYTSSAYPHTLLIKYDVNGNILWDKSFDYNVWINRFIASFDIGENIKLDSLGNIYILSTSGFDYTSLIIKYDSLGNRKWVVEIDPINDNSHKEMIIDSSGIYIGGHKMFNGSYFFSVLKLDFDGKILWENLNSNEEAASKKMIKHKNGMILSGHTNPPWDLSWVYYVVHYNNDGVIDWEHKEYISSGQNDINDIYTDETEGIYITGVADNSDDAYSYKLFDCNFISPNITNIKGKLIADIVPGATYTWYSCKNDSVVLTGVFEYEYTPLNENDFKVLIKLNSCNDSSVCVNNLTKLSNSFDKVVKVYPNPFHHFFNIEMEHSANYLVQVYDMLGRLKIKKEINSIKDVRIDGSKLDKGIYYVHISNNKNGCCRDQVDKELKLIIYIHQSLSKGTS